VHQARQLEGFETAAATAQIAADDANEAAMEAMDYNGSKKELLDSAS
jgi:hypothetical protein